MSPISTNELYRVSINTAMTADPNLLIDCNWHFVTAF